MCLAALTGFAAPAQALHCTTPTLAALVGVEHSRWQEFDSQGRSLLREGGDLAHAGMEAAFSCAGVDWTAQWTHRQGTRAYDGVTNTQVAVQTSSRIDGNAISLNGMAALSEHWSLGARFDERRIARDIRGTGTVLGFPEDYAYGLLALGARYQTVLASQWPLGWVGWIGTSTRGKVRVQLPHVDVATLPLGRTTLLETALQIGTAASFAPGWSWQGRLGYRHERTGAGAARALLRNGIVVGAAMQPEIRLRSYGAELAARYRF